MLRLAVAELVNHVRLDRVLRQHCTRSTTEGIHMRNGPGFICLSVAVCLKGLSVLMHLWLRVPEVSDDDDKAPRDDEEGPEESKDGGGEESK